jgi:hypothetical protein
VSHLLKIADTHPAGEIRVFLSMLEILDPFRPEADSLAWSILDLREAVPKEGSGFDPIQVDRGARASPTGLHMTFPALRDFAGQMTQIIDGLGCGPDPVLDRFAQTFSDVTEVEPAAAGRSLRNEARGLRP